MIKHANYTHTVRQQDPARHDKAQHDLAAPATPQKRKSTNVNIQEGGYRARDQLLVRKVRGRPVFCSKSYEHISQRQISNE